MIKDSVIKMVWFVMLLLLPCTAGAQTNSYNPENPPDPMTRYKVTVSAEPAEAGYVSGGGKYAQGATVNLSTSSRNSSYEFLYWMQDGVRIDKDQAFAYIMGNDKTSFVAVYGYNPPNPGDPEMYNRYRLYLNTSADGSCTFNMTSGLKQEAGQYVTVAVQNISPGFVFIGWYVGDEKVSSSQSFNYLMPSNDITLTAHLVYNPSSPGDPVGSDQTDVDQNPVKQGDVNGDGEVNEVDAQLILDVSVGQKSVSDLRVPAAINVPGGNSNALEVNAQIVLDYSVASVKPW